MDSISNGVATVLEALQITTFQKVQYCDDAYIKIKKAAQDQAPFDLLITDLSFKADHRTQKYPSGEILVKALKQEHPNLKTIVYSVEDRPAKIRTVLTECKTEAYVCKGRNGLKDLTEAIHAVYNGQRYISPQLVNTYKQSPPSEIDDYDIELMKLLANGLSQEEMSIHFKNNDIKPSSISSIEKRIVKLRNHFNANNSIQLISIVKDLGII